MALCGSLRACRDLSQLPIARWFGNGSAPPFEAGREPEGGRMEARAATRGKYPKLAPLGTGRHPHGM